MSNRYKKSVPASINKRVGRAMHDHTMLAEGDRVLLAVSGGVDSLVLAWLLSNWQRKAPISYSLHGVTVDHGFWREHEGALPPEEAIGQQVTRMGVTYSVEPAWEMTAEQRSCYQCARNRRSQLFELARQQGYTKVALGHHKDDLVETLFLNMIYSGNISTMVPKQQLFAGRLSIIRPMAYLEKHEILELADLSGVMPVPNLCPLAKDTRREVVREMLADIYQRAPEAKQSIFASLANVRKGYML